MKLITKVDYPSDCSKALSSWSFWVR